MTDKIVFTLRAEVEQLLAEVQTISEYNGQLADIIAERDAEVERLRAAIAWTREVRPGKNAESGGAIVHMTWDQFNAMRALAKEPKL
jgi:hypothetical protein